VIAADAEVYRQFVIYGFSKQRANLGKSYKKVFSHLQWKRLAHDLGFDVHAGPRDLSFDQWFGVFQFFIEGLRTGFVKIPAEMSSLSAAATTAPSTAKAKRDSVDTRWKHRKAKQAR
jgi:hypothetical protein